MGYRNLRECIEDLERTGQLVRIEEEVDPDLEAAEIQRRVFRAGGPAIYYARAKGSSFPMVSNLFGTEDRARHIFRDTLADLERLMKLGCHPVDILKGPLEHVRAARLAIHALPKRVADGPVFRNETSIAELPQVRCWPNDGGAYILLPQVYTESPDHPGLGKSNLGMYRVQISGGQYEPGKEAGLHYQLHRGIAAHHAAAIRTGVPLRANIFVGGPPAVAFAAAMPLPEDVPEVYFAGSLGRRRVRMAQREGQLPISAEADFAITGFLDPEKTLPEGPFGDHLGYYSLEHEFPVFRVEKVYHRDDAIWPFTVVGRPPQEDSILGKPIHELTGPVIPEVLPGVHAVHAVDAAGVHPLLLAVGSERYVPYEERRSPKELLTQANAILGEGQLSLAKYLMICAREDAPSLDVHDTEGFFEHMLRRVDWRRDLHFQTQTTIDTLDHSGSGLNRGSKAVIAAVGEPIRDLRTEITADLGLPEGFRDARLAIPGVLCVTGPPSRPGPDSTDGAAERFCTGHSCEAAINAFPLIVVADDAEFAAKDLRNLLWVTFTRSDPASDIYGIGASVEQKHWGCSGALVIDARLKPHHAPPLEEDPEIARRVDRLAESGGPLHAIL